MFPIIDRGKLSGIRIMSGLNSVAYFLLTFPIADAVVGIQRVKAVDHQRHFGSSPIQAPVSSG
jgi:hypothetical protein